MYEVFFLGVYTSSILRVGLSCRTVRRRLLLLLAMSLINLKHVHSLHSSPQEVRRRTDGEMLKTDGNVSHTAVLRSGMGLGAGCSALTECVHHNSIGLILRPFFCAPLLNDATRSPTEKERIPWRHHTCRCVRVINENRPLESPDLAAPSFIFRSLLLEGLRGPLPPATEGDRGPTNHIYLNSHLTKGFHILLLLSGELSLTVNTYLHEPDDVVFKLKKTYQKRQLLPV